MEHQTWTLPPADQRSRGAQALDDLKFTLILWWRYLIGPFVKPPAPLLAESADKLPVIIVPGFICRPAIYTRMQATLHAAGYPVYILDLGYQVSSIYRKGRRLSDLISEIGAPQVHVVAHSMGGLILLSALYQGEARIRHGWTLGAPIHGTNIVYAVYGLALAIILSNLDGGLSWYLAVAALFLSAGLRQMLPGSDLITFLSERYGQMRNVTAVFCQQDLIVFGNPLKEPGSSSRFGRPDDVLFPEVGHNNIAMGDNAIRCLCAAIQEFDAAPAAARAD